MRLPDNFIDLKKNFIKIIQRLAIELIDPFFQNRHPKAFIIRITEFFSYIILKTQPNDRWNLHIFVKEWSKGFRDNRKKNKKKIFMFACYRGRFSHNILLAIILAKMGHKITLGYLPKLRSPIKEPLQESKGTKEYLNYVMTILEKETKGKIKCYDLTNFFKINMKQNNDFNNQAHSDTVMMLKKENINLNLDVDKKAYNFCLERLKFIDNAITNFFKKNQNFDICIIPNGATFENSQIIKNAQKFKINFNTYEKFAFKNALTMTHQGPFVEHLDLDIIIDLLKKNNTEHGKIKNIIKKKSLDLLFERKHSTGNHWGFKYQKRLGLDSYTKKWLKTNIKDKKYVLICPNVPFDAGYGSFNGAFPQMKKWLLDTTEFILSNSDLTVVVRAHPAEDRLGFGNEKTDILMNNSGINSSKLIVIPSSSPLNTYELIDQCFFGSVYSSTTGVELSMLGKPVISGANIYHARVGVTKGAKNSNEYFKIIRSCIDGSIKQSPEDIYKAQLVYFLFHFVLQHPYPYDKPSQMVQKPINKFFYEPEFSKYNLTFELLTMDKTEYTSFFDQNISKLTEIWK
jgi:hypothetical protein